MSRTFPVLRATSLDEEAERRRHGCPRSVPWDMLIPHEDWAVRTHAQTLTRLAERGGLAPCEIVAVVEHRRWRAMTTQESVERLLELVVEWHAP